jgi:hypothetical protein
MRPMLFNRYIRLHNDHLIDTVKPDGVHEVYGAYTNEARSKFKLGKSYQPGARIHQLRLGNDEICFWFSMPGSILLDCLLKARLGGLNIDREIFGITPELVAYLRRLVPLRRGRFFPQE